MEEKNKFQARVGGYRLDEVNENFSNLDTCSALITWWLLDYFSNIDIFLVGPWARQLLQLGYLFFMIWGLLGWRTFPT